MRCVVVAWLLCAWILWQHTDWRGIPGDERKGTEHWGIGEIFDDRAKCERDLEATVAKALSSTSFGYRTVVLKRELAVSTLATTEEDRAVNKAAGWPKAGIVTTYRCLPSGTDPRPRS